MKIGVVSDIHGNLPALQAVVAKLQEARCALVLCAGDVVGYGAQPSQCIEIVRELGMICVIGNHDHMVAYPGREQLMRKEVRIAIEWSRANLTKEEIQWLGQLPREASYAGFNLVHASHVFRPEWHYVLDERSLCANFLFQTSPLAFNGHTHLPAVAVHCRGRRPLLMRLQEFDLPHEGRCLVNVGSVGQPRDRRPQAAFAVYDTHSRHLSLGRADYDIAAAQRVIREAGLPAFFADRLALGR